MRKKRENKKEIAYAVLIIFILIFCICIIIILLAFLTRNPPQIFFSPEEISGAQYAKDCSINNENPLYVSCGEEGIFVGTAGSTKFKSLIYFNISTIPQSDYILSAKLNITVKSTIPSCLEKINISRITNPWNENYVSWNRRDNSIPWTAPGGDYSPEITNSTVSSSGANYLIDITSLVNYWHDYPTENYGLMIYPGDNSECLITIESTQSLVSNSIPKLIVNHVSSMPPQIGSVSTNAQTLQTLKNVGENVTFNVNWDDSDDSTIKLFICNTSEITPAGCTKRSYCSASNQPHPATCQYTVLNSDNRTSRFYAGVCDLESCSNSSEIIFYMNHPSNVTIISPNGGETIGIVSSYLIKFNVSDKNKDLMSASIYFGPLGNLTQTLIKENLSLQAICTDSDNDRSTQNNCTYDWNPSAFWQENVYITVFINDSRSVSNDSSDNFFNIHALEDPNPPAGSNYFIPSQFYSGQDIRINASAKDDESSVKSIWASINTTPQTNVILSLYQGDSVNGNYSGIFTGISTGSYKLKIYIQDQRNNQATSPDLNFQVLKPNPEIKSPYFPPLSLPYHIIKISGEINATTSLKGVSAMLNVPNGFSFLNESPQYRPLGNCTENNNLKAEWFVSAPLPEGDYILNITYYDQYFNTWNSENFTLKVTSAIGSGASINSVDIVGYPVIALEDDYYAEIYFKKSGILSNANKVEAILYNPARQVAFGPFEVTDNPQQGVYNFTRQIVGMTGQWELLVNITDASNSYYANQFFSLISGIFDVRNIQIVNPYVDNLQISFEAYNKGELPTDLRIYWNLTDSSDNPVFGQETSGDQTIGFNPGEVKTMTINPKTSYVGQAKITILGKYGPTWEKEAGASRIFTIQPTGTTPPGSGGGGGGTPTKPINNTADLEITADKIIYASANIEKKISVILKNIGQQELTNIFVELEGINSSEYVTYPGVVYSLKLNESAQFNITLKLTSQAERFFNYVVKSDQLEKKESGLITILNLKDFLIKEIARMRETINLLGIDEKSKTLLRTCSEILDKAEQDISSNQLADAKDKVNQANECIIRFRNLPIPIENPSKTSDYWIWIVLPLIFVMILVFVAVVYLIYRRLSIINLLKDEKSPEIKKTLENEGQRSSINQRIDDLKRTLNEEN